jgi:hypothetical protein
MKDFWRDYFKYAGETARTLPFVLTPKYFDWHELWKETVEWFKSAAALLILILLVALYPLSVILFPFAVMAEQRAVIKRNKARNTELRHRDFEGEE